MDNTSRLRRGAVILCGGQSARMGRDKASLPFGPRETLLQRVVGILSECVPLERTVCVVSSGQVLPPLPNVVQVVFDRVPNGGPLVALAAGLHALENTAYVAYVCGCDAPLLRPAFVTRMFDLLDGHEIAAPHDGARWHPLAGVYRTELSTHIDECVTSSGMRSLQALLEARDTRGVSLDELRSVDCELQSLATCNTPEEYAAALRAAGISGGVESG